MTHVRDLSHGWSLYAEWAYRDDRTQMDLQFRHRDGRARNPFEFASSLEARSVFRELKRQLDVLDAGILDGTRARPGREFIWDALDRAVLALQLSLIRIGRWEAGLMDTGVLVQ
jgi:hypothetical protein